MCGSKDTVSDIPNLIALPDLENNIHPLCTDAREEVELHGNICKPAAIFIGKLYSDLHYCTILFKQTVDAAQMSDPIKDIPLPTNGYELKKEFDQVISAYSLYSCSEIKLRKRCIQKVKSIETLLYNMTNENMTVDECIHLYGIDPHVFTDYILPKLIFITKLVCRFRNMSETLLYCYQRRLGYLKSAKEKDTIVQALAPVEEIYTDDDSVKYEAMEDFDFDDYVDNSDNEEGDFYEYSVEYAFDEEYEEPKLASVSLFENQEEQCNRVISKNQSEPSHLSTRIFKSFGFFLIVHFGAESIAYLASASAEYIASFF